MSGRWQAAARFLRNTWAYWSIGCAAGCNTGLPAGPRLRKKTSRIRMKEAHTSRMLPPVVEDPDIGSFRSLAHERGNLAVVSRSYAWPKEHASRDLLWAEALTAHSNQP